MARLFHIRENEQPKKQEWSLLLHNSEKTWIDVEFVCLKMGHIYEIVEI